MALVRPHMAGCAPRFRRATSAASPLLPLLLLLLSTMPWLLVAAPLPPPPARHFNDYAGAVSPAVAAELDGKLAQFERDTSSQIVVATFQSLPPGEVLEDHVTALYKHWGIGLKGTNNGALLVAFLKDRALRIEVGYGLEGAIPDALAKRIIEDAIVPAFRNGDFEGGFRRGVDALIAAARGEYQGTGRTLAEQGTGRIPLQGYIIIFTFCGIIAWHIAAAFLRRRYPKIFGPPPQPGMVIRHKFGRHVRTFGSGGGFGGFGGGGGGGGGFRGGGGFSGGGGASGRW